MINMKNNAFNFIHIKLFIPYSRQYNPAESRCFVRYPYGLASFYGPVVIAVLIIWGLFFSVARVIMRAMAAKSKQKGESDLAMRRVSGVSVFLNQIRS